MIYRADILNHKINKYTIYRSLLNNLSLLLTKPLHKRRRIRENQTKIIEKRFINSAFASLAIKPTAAPTSLAA